MNRELSCLKAVFRQALAWGHVDVSPTAGVSSLREPPNPPRLLSSHEVARLLDEMPVQLRAAIGCAVYAGLRKGEILRLRWEDVDLKVGVLTVASREGRTTKNYEDRRIPLASALSDLLQQHPHRLHSEFVFANAQGGERVELRKSLNGAAKRAGIDKVTMHQLRHAFCSHALMVGADPRSVQAWMGHKDLRTTLRYAHTLPEHEHAAIQRVKYEVEEQAEIASQW